MSSQIANENVGQEELRALPPALDGPREDLESGAGRLSLYKSGAGRPLLLIHSVNAAASAAEVRPLFDHYRACRRVFALELPGFGFSERSQRRYTARLMTDAIHAAAVHVRAECGDEPMDALAVSLSCEFLARAALERPQFRSLALVSPTGFSSTSRGADPRPGESWFYKLLTKPGWGGPLFRLLARPRIIRYFLERTWGSRKIDERLWRYDVLSASQPGAEHAPLYFISGGLFSAAVYRLYQQLQCPVWMSTGVRGDFVDYQNAALVESRDNWRHSVFDSGALPYFERPEEFFSRYDCFLEQASGAKSIRARQSATASWCALKPAASRRAPG